MAEGKEELLQTLLFSPTTCSSVHLHNRRKCNTTCKLLVRIVAQNNFQPALSPLKLQMIKASAWHGFEMFLESKKKQKKLLSPKTVYKKL